MRDDETIDVGPVHVLGEDGYCVGDCPHPDHGRPDEHDTCGRSSDCTDPTHLYTCEGCGGIGHRDLRVLTHAEYAARFGPDDDLNGEGLASVCDDCYPRIIDWARREGLIP